MENGTFSSVENGWLIFSMRVSCVISAASIGTGVGQRTGELERNGTPPAWPQDTGRHLTQRVDFGGSQHTTNMIQTNATPLFSEINGKVGIPPNKFLKV